MMITHSSSTLKLHHRLPGLIIIVIKLTTATKAKIRLAIASKTKRTSGGARVLSFAKIIDETVFLLSIYSKGEIDSLTDKEIIELIKDYLK